ncbi:MAG: 16S rRNA (uracil(1498)-N(3))-methyltransferase [Congregibacter sp.]
MNLLLVEASEVQNDGYVVLRDRRLEHINRILKLKQGDQLRVGVLNGNCGSGEIISIDRSEAVLQIAVDDAPPTPLALTVVLALPRPKMLRRILRTLAETGVKDIHLINSFRVEKSYWQSPLLENSKLREALRSGLEQAMDTVLPRVELHSRFRPFAEDALPGLCLGRTALLADPGAPANFPSRPRMPALLLIGPEGGFIPFECELLCAAGAFPVNMGPRILRVETALQCALGPYLLNRQSFGSRAQR